jgi:hypothetical protein
LRFTNKEVKELKYFADRFKKYHEELRNQVFQQYVKLVKETQAMMKKVKSVPHLQMKTNSIAANMSAVWEGLSSNRSAHNLLLPGSARLNRKRTISGNTSVAGSNNDDFLDAQDHFSEVHSALSRAKT